MICDAVRRSSPRHPKSVRLVSVVRRLRRGPQPLIPGLLNVYLEVMATTGTTRHQATHPSHATHWVTRWYDVRMRMTQHSLRGAPVPSRPRGDGGTRNRRREISAHEDTSPRTNEPVLSGPFWDRIAILLVVGAQAAELRETRLVVCLDRATFQSGRPSGSRCYV